MPERTPAIIAAVRLAHRFIDQLTPAEQQHVLTALVEIGTQPEAAAANDALFHRRAAVKAQLTLRSIIDGIGQQPTEKNGT